MTLLEGLSQDEVLRHRAAGQGNNARFETSRSYAQIVRENAFTFINTVLFGIGIVLVAMGSPGNAIVTAGLVLLNVVVGVVQEGRAKQKLDRIALLTRPKATVLREGKESNIDPGEIVLGDILVVRPGDQIVVDGVVVGDGRMEVDESLLTGESDLVPKRAGDDVLSGSFCVTGAAAYEGRKVGNESYANRLTAGARAFRRIKTPLQHDIDFVIRMMVLLASLLGLLMAVSAVLNHLPAVEFVKISAVIVVLVPQGLFFMTTLTYATGAVRMAGKGALIQQGNAIESMSNVDVLCMDKTGTLTSNRILYQDAFPLGMSEEDLCRQVGDFVATLRDRNRTAEAIAAAIGGTPQHSTGEVPFSSARKWSALSFAGDGDGSYDELRGTYVLGAPEVLGARMPALPAADRQIERWVNTGMRVLMFAHARAEAILPGEDGEPQLPASLAPLGLLSFSDELRPEAAETLREFRDTGIQLKIISGDNPQTVASLARQAGFDPHARAVSGLDLAGMDEDEFAQAACEASIFGRITPQQKERLVRTLRQEEHYVAMVGDGVNDVLALKQAQLAIAMETGSQAPRAIADMILLDDSFAALPAAFREGQRIIRGMQDIMRLFLARTFYVTMLIIGAGIIGAPFPVIPKHNFILALLTVGIPTLGLAAWARPAPAERKVSVARPRSTLITIRHYVFPAAFTVAGVSLGVYIYALFAASGLPPHLQIAIARTALTTTTVLCGLVLIPFVEPPTPAWAGGDDLSGDWRPTLLAGAMLVLYVLAMTVPGARSFFELSLLPIPGLALVLVLVATWAITLRFIWRHDLFERLLELS